MLKFIKTISFVFLLGIFALFLIGFLNRFSGSYRKPIPQDEVFNSVNKWRTENGHRALEFDQRLCELAEVRLNQLHQFGFSHQYFLQESKKTANKYNLRKTGENLYNGPLKNGDAITKMWLSSPTHKANIEGYYDSSCMRCDLNYCVQIFASY